MPDSRSHRGVVHGRMIELNDVTGLRDGQHVAVLVRAIDDETSPPRARSSEDLLSALRDWAPCPETLEATEEFVTRQRSIPYRSKL